MNAKITITVPIEKVHLTIADMLETVSIQLTALAGDAEYISKKVRSEEDILRQLESIDSARKIISLLDANLDDCYSVLTGLVSYKTKTTPSKEKENADNSAE
jgi:hypothetical protein